MNNNKVQSFKFRRGLLASAVIAGMGVSSVQAIEIDTGNEDFAVRFDNTIKYNYGVRTENADKTMLNTPNSNDGDYNFRHAGTNITNRIDILSEVDVVFKDSMGFRVSAAGWYDKAYDNVGSNSNPYVNGNGDASGLIGPNPNPFVTLQNLNGGSSHLDNHAQRYYSGPSGEILDAFVFYSTEVGEESLLSMKAGQTNVFWGESLLNPVHSVSYGQSGLDLAKLAGSPGTEAKELFVPRNQLYGSFTLNSEWTFAAQYFLSWDAARRPDSGTYYGAGDPLGQSILLGTTSKPYANSVLGPVCAVSGCNANINVVHGKDYEPDDAGDFGLMAKWSPEWLDGSLGAYYRRTSDILPQVVLDANSLSSGTVDGALPGGFGGAAAQVQGNLLNSAAAASYGLAYARDIDIFGISLSKNIEGVSVGSDLNIRHNMPLASVPMAVGAELNAGLPISYALGGVPIANPLPGLLPDLATNGPRAAGTGSVAAIPGHNYSATGDTLHFTLNGLTTFADTPVFDSAVLIAEVYYSNLLSLNNTNSGMYKGKSSYRGIDASDRDNVGMGLVFTPTWYQVAPGVDMTMPVAMNVGIDGNSPVNGGGNKDTGSYSLGVGAQVYNKYFVDLKYVDYFGKTDKCNDSGYENTGPLAPGDNSGSGDGSTPSALAVNSNYGCWGGGYSSFSGAGATLEDRGAVYLTFKTTI